MVDVVGGFGVVAAAMASILVVSAAAFAFLRRSGTSLNRSGASAAKRLALVVIAALVLAFAVSYVTSARSSNTQTFALSGAERWTVGPFLYVTFGLLLVSTRHVGGLRAVVSRFGRTPSAGLAVLVLLTGVVGLLLGATTPLQTAQGIALLLGFSLFLIVGSSTLDWDAVTRRMFVAAIVGAGLLSIAMQVGLGSFPALTVPACAGAIALAGSAVLPAVVRVLALAVGAGSIILLYVRSADSNDPSAGLQLQMAFAVGIAVVAVLPRRARPYVGFVLAAGIVWSIATSPLAQITFGGLANDPDPTIAQRGYETQAVWSAVSSSPFTLLFGLGPGATVDLHLSPDAATLLASGRDLFHVPSVHLLTSYVLLKAGVFGLVWLAVILVKLFSLTLSELRRPRPDAFAVLLLCLPWCGLAAAIPAATFFFSNPLCALGLGLLIARSSTRGALHRSTELTRAAIHEPTPALPRPTVARPLVPRSERGRR